MRIKHQMMLHYIVENKRRAYKAENYSIIAVRDIFAIYFPKKAKPISISRR